MGDASHVAAILLLFGVATADAQIAPPPPVSGAYQKLSPGNQKVARALFEAQTVPMTPKTKTGNKTAEPETASAAPSGNGPKPLTLDQIAAMKQQGAGWEHVFRQMRAQGLVTDKSIGQLMTRHNQSRPSGTAVVATGAAASGGAAVSASPGPDASRANPDTSYGRSGNLR
jgi:hypothetical protein